MDLQWTVGEDDAGLRLDKFLAAAHRLGSRGRAASALQRGKVLVNGSDVSLGDASRRVANGDVVRVWMDRPGSARRPLGTIGEGELQIVYEDDAVLVLNKPAGLLAVPLDRRSGAESVYDLIEDRLRSHARRRPFVVHRIDRDTSGLVIFARDARAQAALKAQFRRREPERVYWAIVYGQPNPEQGTWRDHLVWDEAASLQKKARPRDPGAKEAISDYRVLETFEGASLVEVRLQTGKRNQIRLQAGLRGHALVGERRYVSGPEPLGDIPFPRQALHAYRLTFRHPDDGRVLAFEAPLPEDLRELLTRLRRG
jgi:23S rRNA pseudouridine1911/1915/1917 synthase